MPISENSPAVPGVTVAIVGAGLSGFYAARLLHAAGVQFQILEARDRVGGRILSVDEAGRPSEDGFDLGPSWFWPKMQPAMSALVEELGLSGFRQFSEGDVVFERFSREGPLRHPGPRQEPQSIRLVGGTAALVRALLAGLPEGCIRCNARVTRMTLAEDGVRLTIARSSGGEEDMRVSHVIMAVPPRLLEATVGFVPALDPSTARRWRETPTWMAPHAKFFALYERPFWREAGLTGTAQSMVGPMMEIHDATTASGQPGLFGFVGMGPDQRAAVGEAALTRACLEQFARIFGPQARQPRATLYKDWATDPFTATPADRGFTGHPTPAGTGWVTGAWHQRLAMAGSETSPTEPGFLAGAVEAARRAVSDTLERIRPSG
ncbi:flavin monoamine oxidase family protein [Microvirga arsenatis]|uniref:NAD(P)-binding protein n=1 Tax=Microvirga arsenatis TaxID=2692265 RepID=A0ABW9Z283_9HYPH|nr:FAD-dependent oxidoreductase [Microvirga arsenatis]NBJ12993.1 NAD(P)-binding protein [Microvirga arsenatis]NBJ26783.1 NAD(P)-binding protein [Microvirga arsenatis]